MGGISGYDTNESTDESPERVALVQELTLAYLRTALYAEDSSWENIKEETGENAHPKFKIDSKGY